MPLFGKKHNKNATNAAANNNGRGGVSGAGAGQDNTAYDGQPPAVDGAPTGRHQHATGRGGAGNYDATDRHDFAGNGPQTGAGVRSAGVSTGAAYNDGRSNNVGNDPYAGQAGQTNPNIPPATAINQNPGTGRHTGHSTTGRVEQAVGSLVGSQALQERGQQKEQEANAFKSQSAEIAEAERLEHEAQMRRDRAVAHGAHPQNRQLGGVGGASGVYDGQGAAASQTGGY